MVGYAWTYEVPITARGAGSSLEGNPIPVRGGIVLDLSRMDALVEVHQEDLQVSVQPGIVYNQLNEQLKPWGLFFPPSPGGSSDVGRRLAVWSPIMPAVSIRSNTVARASM